MGLFNKNNGYVKTRNSSGDVVYMKGVPDSISSSFNSVDDVKDKISSLKSSLEDVMGEMRDVNRGITSPNRSYDNNGSKKARMKDMKSLQAEKNKIINSLASLGVHVVPQSLYGSKIQYRESADEGGTNVMFTDAEINKMRLAVHESARSGEISDTLKDYLLLTIESTVEDYNEHLLNEEMHAMWVEEAKENYATAKLHLFESFEAGIINEDQLSTMLESLGEEEDYVDKEVSDKESKKAAESDEEDEPMDEDIVKENAEEFIAELTNLYIEACKEGNECAKAKIKEKLEEVKKIKDGVKEKGKEKLSSVKKKLKEVSEKLSAKDKEKVNMMRKRVSGGKGDIEDLKDEKPMLNDTEESVHIEYAGPVSDENLKEFSREVLTTEAYANLTDAEKERMATYFESIEV